MKNFFHGKRVFITGHSGFKGTWLSVMLIQMGADVTGYSLCRDKKINFYTLSNVEREMRSVRGDVRNLDSLQRIFKEVKPEIVIHMAAQPIVRESYLRPVDTYSTNVMGTVNILECVRQCDSVRAFLNVTTDKVYLNSEQNHDFQEDDPLDGYDPYSNSKSCSELVTHSYYRSFFQNKNCAVSTARAGNVIGGGDFSPDRIIPDCVRAAVNHRNIEVRNPYSIRPYQHVLEPLTAYLMIVSCPEKAGWYNIGPDAADCFSTGDLTDLFVSYWGDNLKWTNCHDGGPHEAQFLKLDNTKFKTAFHWEPRWNLPKAMEKTVEWYKIWHNGGNIRDCMNAQIQEFLSMSAGEGK